MRSKRSRSLIAIFAFSASSVVLAQGKGEGGVFVRQNANLYSSSTGDSTDLENIPRGFAVAGVVRSMGGDKAYELQDENGRYLVYYYAFNKQGKSEVMPRLAYANKSDIEGFTYECGCEVDAGRSRCSPFSQRGFLSTSWNVCFREGMNKRLADLKSTWDSEAKTSGAAGEGAAVNRSQGQQGKPLTNADVLNLAKAGLGDEIVIAKIQQSPTESLDVGVDELIRLKTEGLTKPVLDAMIKRAGQRK